MKNYEILEYNDKYRDSCIDLLKRVFPGSSDQCTFAWRFDTSEENKPIIVCAVDAGKVISFNSWIQWKFKYQEKTFTAYQSGESGTDINYRRMGIWEKVIRLGEKIAIERKIDFFFGFPTPISFRGFIKAGYQHIGTFDLSLRIINPALFRTTGVGQKNHQEFSQTCLLQQTKITPVVSSEYINWRYHKNPKQYQIITYSEKSNLLAFVIKQSRYYNKRFKISFPEIVLLECCTNCFDRIFLDKAFSHLDRLFSRKAVWIRTFFSKQTIRGKALSPYFHLHRDAKSAIFILKKINQELDDNLLTNFDNWDIFPHVVDSI